MRTTSSPVTSFSTSSTSPILNSTDLYGHTNVTSSSRHNSVGMSCFTMILGTVSNLTALGILFNSHARFRRQSKAPFLQLTVTLLLADLGGHLILGAFAIYLHTYDINDTTEGFCYIFGASMVFFGLCPLLLGCAMAVERCVAITQPFFHVSMITVARVKGVVLFVFSLALVLAYLPYLKVGTYTIQFPKTWCFLPIHNPQSAADTNLVLAFSCLGLIALVLSLLCNIVSGVTLLHARKKSSRGYTKTAARSVHRASSVSSASSSSVFFSLDVEMMAQLAAITVVSCVCWGPFLVCTQLVYSLVIQLNQSSRDSDEVKGRVTLLTLRMASWNQILDPWVYILLRRAVLLRVCCGFSNRRAAVTADSSSADTRRRVSIQQ